jgi:hypothetical protein
MGKYEVVSMKLSVIHVQLINQFLVINLIYLIHLLVIPETSFTTIISVYSWHFAIRFNNMEIWNKYVTEIIIFVLMIFALTLQFFVKIVSNNLKFSEELIKIIQLKNSLWMLRAGFWAAWTCLGCHLIAKLNLVMNDPVPRISFQPQLTFLPFTHWKNFAKKLRLIRTEFFSKPLYINRNMLTHAQYWWS